MNNVMARIQYVVRSLSPLGLMLLSIDVTLELLGVYFLITLFV